MSNSTDDFTINLINNISSQVNRYITLFVFLFGTIGNLLNVIVLLQPVLRTNPCALYFLGSSAAGLGIILVGLPSRIVYASSTVMIPSLLMLIFGLLTIRNINRSHRAVQPFVVTVSNISQVSRTRRGTRARRSEGSLTRMLLLQVILLTLYSIPQAVHQFYLTFTINVNKSPMRLAIENFIVNFNFSLTYIGNGISFYIYTLNGTVFRQTLIRIFHLTIR